MHYIRTVIGCLLFILLSLQGTAQTGQVAVPRVNLMPELPSPYLMRDWKAVTIGYDALIYNVNATGQYLPTIGLRSAGTNYPALQPILLDTYVGTTSPNQAEAINILPSLVGASLVGINKLNQNGTNWVAKAADFFNKANGQNVYLNGYAATSGGDWWYDTMPNVFFYQLYSQYPSTQFFDEQFTTVADRWLAAVRAMGGSTTPWTVPQMNYRAWKLASMTPLTTGVKEPESAGAIAWLLYHAYGETGDKKYLDGAQQSMEFLSALTANPSYELQLPYGTYTAARMNAELGTAYDISKMVNWSFDRGALRGWGTIVGKWDGSDVSGVIGEANDGGNDYAFIMNGFQQAAAFVPMVKYDKRFARAIAKWTLNLANASRLFYSQYVPQASQDDFAWSSTNDPQSFIAYEALKENIDGKKLYATGDAKRGGWAETNLSLYSSSSVGYLGAIVETTDVEGILLLNMNNTDFFGQNAFPSYLVFNPHATAKQVTLPLGAASYDIYDAISETVIKTGATGNTLITLPAGEVRMLVYLPAGSTPEEVNGKLILGDDVVDYNYGYHFEGEFRIKSLSAVDTVVAFNHDVQLFSTVENAPAAVTYKWYVNDELESTTTTSTHTWTAPATEGHYKILLEATSGALTVKDSIMVRVVATIPTAPVITSITTDALWYNGGATATLTCHATNAAGGILQYQWTVNGGTIVTQDGATMTWTVPTGEGIFNATCKVTNEDDLSATLQKGVLVKSTSTGTTAAFAYYPLDGDVLDYSGNNRNASLSGTQLTVDARGISNRARKFTTGTDIIFVPNENGSNFQNQITLSFWVKLDAASGETFILSHGSWEERWKVSVTPDKKLRWTVKTASGTKDLDSSFPLNLNEFYHFTVLYSSYSMELYADGELDAYVAQTGFMGTTGKPVTFGRKDDVITDYGLRGTVDEVRIYDKALAPNEIETLKTIWNTVTGTDEESGKLIRVYPNPSTGSLDVIGNARPLGDIALYDVAGRKIASQLSYNTKENSVHIEFDPRATGLLILKIENGDSPLYKKVMVKK